MWQKRTKQEKNLQRGIWTKINWHSAYRFSSLFFLLLLIFSIWLRIRNDCICARAIYWSIKSNIKFSSMCEPATGMLKAIIRWKTNEYEPFDKTSENTKCLCTKNKLRYTRTDLIIYCRWNGFTVQYLRCTQRHPQFFFFPFAFFLLFDAQWEFRTAIRSGVSLRRFERIDGESVEWRRGKKVNNTISTHFNGQTAFNDLYCAMHMSIVFPYLWM